MVLALLVGLHFFILVLKYLLLNMAVLSSGVHIHDNMIESVLRSPCSYFDETSSGSIIGNFSNDLGIIDSKLVLALTDAL